MRNREIISFFAEKGSDCLFTCSLDDDEKWKKLGDFMGIAVPEDLDIHSNKSEK